MSSLFPALDAPPAKPALRFTDQTTDRTIDFPTLRSLAHAVAGELRDQSRVAVWATPTAHTAVGVVGALLAGVPVVPINPKSGARELAHVLGDSEPSLVLTPPGVELPPALAGLAAFEVPLTPPDTAPAAPAAVVDPELPALIVYTSGTTGPPKGVLVSHRAVAATLDALADAWQWTADDEVVHGLPLFHVHGLVLGVLGPLRRGGTVRHLGRFSTAGVRDALSDGGTVLFGVPTMYHRLAEAVETDRALAEALAGARLLVSGSAPLPLPDHERLWAATGRRIVERYGMSETLMNTSVRADGPPATGTVGVALPGVEVRLVDEDGRPLAAHDSVGEIQVRGPNLFSGYLNRPDATAEAFDADGWFRTGDMATRDSTGGYRIVGRKSTDLIKSGGYKIGAGEIENVLLAHPAVAEAAVTAGPDPDLGERVIAWVVPRDPESPPSLDELSDHVVGQLAAHKRPREVRFLAALPRNELGKVLKRELV
ncbi:acyl-CoA synthetase [Streptomyces sp. NBRC 109706]|uniref:acyl-CoA synthetase n=1 Tax=Streptomyces sp. NBRC 109706 TaxID=1550035 RepID=UPI00078336DF|nr:acyl-CoA synthetase [Streptomyces sp. NBRC 109706]